MTYRIGTLTVALALLGSSGPGLTRAQDSGAEAGLELGPAPRVDWSRLKVAPDAAVVRTAGSGNWVDTSNRNEVATAWNSSMATTQVVAMGWTGTVSPCAAGTTSNAWRDAVRSRINWFRGMAGVPTGITFDSVWGQQDQEAALMMSANRTLSHNPATNWTCYTANGDTAAGKSNLCYGTGLGNTDPGCVAGYIADPGTGNSAVGHRRWLLFPQTRVMATGDVAQSGTNGRANAIWVIDGNSSMARPATRDEFVAWPPKGYVPYQAVYGRWSLSYPNADFTNATITMTRVGGSAIGVTKLAPETGFGENTVVWEPAVNLGVASTTDVSVDVIVSGVMVSGAARSFTYRVTVFDPATATTPPPPPEGLIDVTVTSVPAGLSVTVDGTAYTTPRTFSWVPSTTHTLFTTLVQDRGVAGERFVFTNWSSGSSATQTITPLADATYTASFSTHYRLQTAGAPAGAGFVQTSPSPADGYHPSGQVVTLTGVVQSGQPFLNWSGDVTGTTNPTSITMSKPSSVTANFGTPAPTTVSVTVTSAPVTGLSVVVDGVTYASPRVFSWTPGSSHTINTLTQQNRGIGGERFLFDAWSGGLSAPSQTVAPTTNATYTANFTTQYQLQAAPSPSAGGSINSTPASGDGYYNSGTVVTLNSGALPGYSFSNWSGDASGSNAQTTVVMSKASVVTAVFTPAATSNSGLHFVPVTPCRIADTRNPADTFGGPALVGNVSRSFPIPQSNCAIPSTAKAYSLNITVVPSVGLGYLTIWPTGQAQPFVSTLNANDAQVTANAAIVPAGTNGAVSLYATNTTHVIIDINGYFDDPAAANSLAFYPVSPCRVADTRQAAGPFGGPIVPAGGTRTLDIRQSSCGLPPSASAYSFNVTVVPPGALGYISVWPAGQSQPLVSTTNSYDGQVTANLAIVPAGTSGAVNFYASNQTHLVVDVTGYFAPPGLPGALKFFPVTPCRIADTRSATGSLGGPVINTGSSRSFPFTQASCGLPTTAQAYSANFTVVPAGALGYITTWPTGSGQPFVSTLNSYNGQITANAALVRAGTGGAVSVFASDRTHVVIDTNGYFAP